VTTLEPLRPSWPAQSWMVTFDPLDVRASITIWTRIEKAQELGCTLIVSQTLTMLKDSYANLQRVGFEEVYEQEVYECAAGLAVPGTHATTRLTLNV
jgi:hypothetical protein